ncbi:MAG: sigma-70 family RNA polymerase sigma factor [Peptostreptococcaceae bacterium]|nr:sigma-70 family RNA polymerase sigma factor [Peptostreptococcaceae bacterium]
MNENKTDMLRRAAKKQRNSYEEVDAMLHRAKNGDIEAEGELIVMMEPLILKYCRYYFGFSTEDLIQQGRIRALELIRRFDTSKSEIRFLGYMTRFIACFYWDMKKDELRRSKNMSYFSEDGLEKASYDERGFLKIEVNDLLQPLDPEQRYIITQNIMYGTPLGEIGSQLQLSTDQVKYLKKKALGRLRKQKFVQ